MKRVWMLSLGLMLAACGNAVNPNDGGNGGDTGGSDAPAVDGGGGNDAIASDVPAVDSGSTGCPANEPTSGGACTVEGRLCTYGSDPALHCRDRAACMGGVWQVIQANCTGTGTCPAAAPTSMEACTNTSTVCDYDDGTRCLCAQCPPAGPACMPMSPRWFCEPPPMDARCPRRPVNLGTSCTDEGVFCDYGGCSGGWAVTCTSGVWVQQQTPCPA